MLYVDIPSLADLKSLVAHRDDICVSIYLPTTPVSREAAGDRIELKNLAKEALRQLETANADKRRNTARSFGSKADDDCECAEPMYRACVSRPSAAIKESSRRRRGHGRAFGQVPEQDDVIAPPTERVEVGVLEHVSDVRVAASDRLPQHNVTIPNTGSKETAVRRKKS